METALRFECQPGCTACCEQHGFVYLTEDDIPRIAAYLGQSVAEFEERSVFRTKNRRRLRVPGPVRCEFLKDGGCSIHAVKPLQCRTFPYWPELVGHTRNWKDTAKYCPGIGKGELVNITLARETAAEMRTAHAHLYDE